MADIYDLALLGHRKVRLPEWEEGVYIEIHEASGYDHLVIDSYAWRYEPSSESVEVRLYEYPVEGWESYSDEGKE